MPSFESENSKNLNQPKKIGPEFGREKISPNYDKNGIRIEKLEPEKMSKPHKLKSLCCWLLQKIDQTTSKREIADEIKPDEKQADPIISESTSETELNHGSEKHEENAGCDLVNFDGAKMPLRNRLNQDLQGHEVQDSDAPDISSSKLDCSHDASRPILDLGTFADPLAVSMESFFEFNFEISESLDDLVAEFELKNRTRQWNEWGDSSVMAGEFDSDDEILNSIATKYPK